MSWENTIKSYKYEYFDYNNTAINVVELQYTNDIFNDVSGNNIYD